MSREVTGAQTEAEDTQAEDATGPEMTPEARGGMEEEPGLRQGKETEGEEERRVETGREDKSGDPATTDSATLVEGEEEQGDGQTQSETSSEERRTKLTERRKGQEAEMTEA